MKKYLSYLIFTLGMIFQVAQAQPGTVCNPAFTFTVTGGTVQVSPTNLNTSALVQHQWTFGDNSFPNYNVAPSHTYSQSGVYNIIHVVNYRDSSNTQGCLDSAIQTITILLDSIPDSCNVHAAFSFVRDSIQPNKVYFTNLTTGGNNQPIWFFGDGTTSSATNPTHIFATSGAFNVCLKAYGNSASCMDETCSIVQVQIPTCNLQAYFSMSIDSTNPNTVHFTNQSAPFNPTDSIRWNFGDGTVSYETNPTHTYAQAGIYNVCIRVKLNNSTTNCVREICRTITLVSTNACNIVPAFEVIRDTTNGNSFYFANMSTPTAGIDTVRWFYGDGTSSDTYNGSHVYTAPGTYNVCLVIKKVIGPGVPVCVREICHSVTVANTNTCNLVAAFDVIRDSAQGNSFYFANQSTPATGIDSVRWVYGDGTTSNGFNGSHTYANSGTYNVCLIIKKAAASGTPACVREICHTVVVNADCNLTADFNFYRDSTAGVGPNTYQFTNTSLPVASTPDSLFWNFGDGSPVAINVNNPRHVYTQPGTYTACLRVKRLIPGTNLFSCDRMVCKTITVVVIPAACNANASFTIVRDSSRSNTFYFNNSSTPVNTAASAIWNFGDGTSSNVWSPSHVYAQSGVYRVCLKITVNNTCVSDTCQTFSVVVPPTSCSWQAAFTTRVSTANVRNIIFQNNTTAVSPNTATASWSFGDGSFASSWNAEHLYTQPGRYFACLTVITADSCVKTTCDTIVVAGTTISCDSARVSFFYRRDNYMQNKLYFFAQSNVGILQQQWSFKRIGDTGTSVFVNQFNPTHIFTDTGRYQVCLRAILPNGCVKETCNTVNIYSTVAPSQCFLQAYPNPARNNVYFNVQLQQPQYINVYVYNAQNMLVRAQIIQGFTGNNNINLNIGSLPNGFYNVRIVHGNAFCYSRFQKF